MLLSLISVWNTRLISSVLASQALPTTIREFMRRTKAKGAGCVIAMLGEHGSLAYDGQRFYHQAAENVPVVNTVGAGDSYIAAFTYGVSLGESIPQCMARGKTIILQEEV